MLDASMNFDDCQVAEFIFRYVVCELSLSFFRSSVSGIIGLGRAAFSDEGFFRESGFHMGFGFAD